MYYFIINPASCSGHRKDLWKTLETILKEENVPYQAAFTTKKGDAERLSAKASAKADEKHPVTIITVGGDGTANEAANGLVLSPHLTFGYIPSGSGNDLARGLALPTKPADALRAILHPSKVQKIRVGKILTDNGTSRRFLISSGGGYDAAVCHGVQKTRLKTMFNSIGLGKLVYFAVALRQLIRMKGIPVTLTLDGEQVFCGPVFFLAFMNTRFEGGGFMFCPEADPSDNILDICFADEMPKPRVLFLLPQALFGKHVKYKDVVHLHRCHSAVLETTESFHVHTDGECLELHKRLEVSLEEEPLSFICG